ncbi:hypothetical protein N8D74_06650 [Curtobacterium flaccumfaciens]|uniref:DNA-binding protein n=1 Tax=Curtobacterium poinsettiae TaxID=159612 RepID=A0A9Q9T479_9MICO|nr:hypothetical protein [Curtobacterium flaccumfaciens]UXN26554.1 hypothetical protein N8D74_06650 [Curtobacterium flaccumfaciens]UYC81396.1 hypothetical protein OE229_02735 [Curtobacterium flaccumfaciens pv. poinsettiae]
MVTKTEQEASGISVSAREKLERSAIALHMDVEQLAQWLFDSTVSSEPAPTPPLSAAERAFLDSASGLTPEQLEEAHREGRRRAQVGPAEQRAHLLAASLSTDDAATALGIGASAVRHRIADGKLWSVAVDGKNRIPNWQFVDVPHPQPRWAHGATVRTARSTVGEVTASNVGNPAPAGVRFKKGTRRVNAPAKVQALRGLDKVVPSIPADTTALSMEGFMRTEQDELLIDGAPVSPLQWLLDERDPAPVAALVADLGAIW